MKTSSPHALPPELLAELAKQGEPRAYARNERLITEGEVSDALFILLSGELKVYTQDERGRELVYNVLRPGELFGEMFLDGGVRSASVRAMSDAQCLVIDQTLTYTLVRTYPVFAELLIRKLIGRVRHTTRLTKSLALSDVYERTAALLVQTAEEEDGVRMVPAALTQQEIADRVGATREMINRVLRELVQGGFLVRNEKRRLVLLKDLPRNW